MFFRRKDKPAVAIGLINLSLLCSIFAFIGMLGYDLYLASTQWILIGLLLGVWAVFLMIQAER